jgi:hypothetical protein
MARLSRKVGEKAWVVPVARLNRVALGDAVPQTPWDLSLRACSSKGRSKRAGRLQVSTSVLESHPSVAPGTKSGFPVSISPGGWAASDCIGLEFKSSHASEVRATRVLLVSLESITLPLRRRFRECRPGYFTLNVTTVTSGA